MSDQTNKTQQEVEQEELLNEADAAIAEEVLDGMAEEGISDELAKAQEEAAQYKEAALRAQADVQNIRRRAELDVEKAHKFALEKFAKSVITVADNLERALSSAEASEEDPLREGVELTYKDLVETLGRFDIVVVDPQGEPFNPELHQAMTMVPNPNMEPNTVMDVVQKGYTLNGRLLRPAMVVVSSAA